MRDLSLSYLCGSLSRMKKLDYLDLDLREYIYIRNK